ncbi:uncharacterized protein C2orf80-like isoform X1 [Syngnathus typhle]|uniref:uncharacterized protein C2orf80-like isoform X1 n=1 Tax=Syngnathus typhle TaxID=161592 RepID=UPI002A6A99C1|nr:uncharacterized protein C2orf80-like isoform X1 [Syngnathus typhle]
MESKQLKRNVEFLLGEYVGQKIRENSFDPRGKGAFTVLDDLAHYDLAISVDVWWLQEDPGPKAQDKDLIRRRRIPGNYQIYGNRLAREAMILSSFAGIIMSSLPVEEILALYRCNPVASYPDTRSKASIVCPFTLSYHPLAMLSSYKAVQHCRKHNQKLKRWLSEKTKAHVPSRRVPAQSMSSSSLASSPRFSVGGDGEEVTCGVASVLLHD